MLKLTFPESLTSPIVQYIWLDRLIFFPVIIWNGTFRKNCENKIKTDIVFLKLYGFNNVISKVILFFYIVFQKLCWFNIVFLKLYWF